jgi:methylenetetrahydrofolate--tRNA-(uracil-5-)-methyltransferase
MGWLAGVNASRIALGESTVEAPGNSAIGSLARYVALTETKNFQPVNITFALLPPLPELEQRRSRKKRERRELQVKLALQEWDTWLQNRFSQDAVVETTPT